MILIHPVCNQLMSKSLGGQATNEILSFFELPGFVSDNFFRPEDYFDAGL